ncbi:MAG: hypothetical protein MUP13_13550 [Thermoanaerobaculales bacterium]|nr:hypothetical protein [Thermoanaerobaculales bacterium]
MSQRILLLDPLTLAGREFLNSGDLLDRLGLDIEFRHTAVDDEHQITEWAGGPALVPALDSTGDLEGYDVIVVASDAQGSRHDHLFEFLDRNPDVAVVDLARLPALLEHTTPSVGGAVETSRHLRVAHPALVATSRLVEVLADFGDIRGTLAIVDPVSIYGREAIELLARQTATRLQGEPVTELIYGHVRTFNVIAIDAFDLQEEAAQVMPNVPLAVTHSLSGVFHGHLAHLGLVFSERVDPDDIRDALSQTEGIEISDLPVSLDAVPDRDFAVITPLVMSPDGRQLAVTIMADGLRIGGALTAIDILASLV